MKPRHYLRLLFASADLSSKRKPIWIYLLRIALASVLGYSLTYLNVDTVESYLYDLRIRYKPSSATSGHIVIVLTDQDTNKNLGKAPELEHYNLALSKLAETQPRFVLFTSEIKSFKGNQQEQIEFAERSKNFFHFYQAIQEPTIEDGQKLPAPFHNIRLIAAPRTHDKNIGARDSVTRRMMIHYAGRDMLYPSVAKTYNPEVVDYANIRGHFELFESIQTYIDYRPKGSFQTLKLEELIQGSVDIASLEDKIILFGEDLETSFNDYILTPYSRDPLAMTRVEMNANMIETLILNSAPIRLSNNFNLILTLLISILTVHVVLTLKPLRGIALLGGTAILLLILAYIFFWPLGYWLPASHPLLSIFLCYYFFIPYRLIVENRRSWEYYQKHKLLTEVEELKTNFIGMMSHDLKTPLARIQGMAELITRDSNPLTETQIEALDTIKYSSEDLTKFITTILNYAKIESQGIELHLQSKDPNALVERVVKQHEFLAKLKHIQLITELEPLFSVPMDPNLIQQVISNLIENAIKYSPENSKVLISTDEMDGKVLIQVADQGSGIPENELENIFMKFYRSNSAKISPIKGSGLGLYLSKYFVELHSGQIYAESSVGQGSTFTVELPVQSPKDS